MNDRVVKNPNFKDEAEFHASLRARGAGTKDYPNTHTEVEYLGNGKFAASIGTGHRVFFDKADDNKPKKHKLTDERPSKDYVLIQGAKCCVEVHPYYAKYFDVQHEEVRLHEERWVVQRLFREPDTWRDVDAYNPVISVEEYPEPAGDVIKVTVTYDTDYGVLTVEYFQRDGNNLKHNIYFTNTSGSTESFRVVRKWAGIPAIGYNKVVVIPSTTDESHLNFRGEGGKTVITENLSSMVFNPDGSEKADQCLYRPIRIDAHAQGMKADFIYGNWILAQNESLEIDPDTATLTPPSEYGHMRRIATSQGACPAATIERRTSDNVQWGGYASGGNVFHARRAYAEWDISSIPDGATITDTVFKYEGNSDSTSFSEINPITNQPTGASDATLWADCASGTPYVDPFNLVVGESQSQDLGAAADTDLEGALGGDWFAIGIVSEGDECPSSPNDKQGKLLEFGATPLYTLYVVYTPAPPEVAKKHTFRLHHGPGHRMEFHPDLKLG